MGTNICKNCNYPINDEFCSKCGHPVNLKKINKDYVIREIVDTLFASKGFFYTTKKILLHPGDSVKYYITEDRSRHVKPVTYLIITALIYALISHFLKTDFLAHIEMTEFFTLNHFRMWIVENRVYSSIIIDLYIAFWIKIFFRKSDYNLFEIFTLMCYLSGIKALLLSAALIFQAFIHFNLMTASIFILFSYSIWAIGQFFEKKKVKSYLKAILSYISGGFSMGLILSVAVIIELMMGR